MQLSSSCGVLEYSLDATQNPVELRKEATVPELHTHTESVCLMMMLFALVLGACLLLLLIQNNMMMREMMRGFKVDFNKLDAKLDAKLDDLKTFIKDGFADHHSFNRRRVASLQRVSGRMTHDGCSGSATYHTLLYRGKVATIVTPHESCRASQDNPDHNGTLLLHPTLDVAIDRRCKLHGSALNVSFSYTTPELGDQVIAFGYGDTASVWKGVISRLVAGQDNCSNNASRWSGNTRICDGEFLAQGHQRQGRSGAGPRF